MEGGGGGDHRELQLLPPPSTKLTSLSAPSLQADASERRSLDLQLSISLGPGPLPPPADRGESVFKLDEGREGRRGASRMNSIEFLKQQAAEQIKLAAVERAYAERVRELTRKEMELAESDFAQAKRTWERAQQELERARRLKDKSTRRIDSTCIEITCQACHQRFQA